MSFIGSHKKQIIALLILLSSGWWQGASTRSSVNEALADESADMAEELPLPQAKPDGVGLYVGTASCAASNCHGGGSRPAALGEDPYSPQSYSIWIQKDPHSRSYSMLFNDVSKRMAKKLAIVKPGEPAGSFLPAHENQVCLNCHTLNPPEVELARPHRHTISDGVGCEACHGPASGWQELHSRPEWRSREFSMERKKELGYRDLTDIFHRGKECVDCHVGGPGREVNHDLIAAGHPRLNFELAAFQASMPKHWLREKAEGGDAAKIEARLLLAGQSLAALAALDQLDRRAAQAAKGSAPWPEFAEYDCYACHHHLTTPSWRQDRDPAIHKAGSYPWGTWSFALLPGLMRDSQQLDESLKEVTKTMSVPYPDEQQVRASVKKAKIPLLKFQEEAREANLNETQFRQTLLRLTNADQLASGGSWEIEDQRFLAVTSLFQSLSAPYHHPDGSKKKMELPPELRQLKEELSTLRKALAFSETEEDVQYASPEKYDSARQQQVQRAFERIHRLYETP